MIEISTSILNMIKGKESEINQREGMYKALKFLSTVDLEDPNYKDYIRTHFKGLEDGLEQFALLIRRKSDHVNRSSYVKELSPGQP